MRAHSFSYCSQILVWLVFVTTAIQLPAQTDNTAAAPPIAPAQRSAAELEKLAMPIALHPDPLIAIILPASVYPVEIVQAARFVRDTNNVPKVDQQPWDENIKAVAKFPELITKMDADLEWTVQLGQAFLDQPKELMDTIQALRAKAQKAGTLKTSPQQVVTVTNIVVIQTNFTQVVTVTNQIVQVQPANPQVVYVPTYPPTVYAPPPAYDPWAPLITFGVAVGFTAIIANNCDWHGGCVWGGGDVDIDINNDINIDRGDRPDRPDRTTGERGNAGNRPAGQQQKKWQPNQSRLNTSGAPSASQREARGWGGSTQAGQRPTSGNTGSRSSQFASSSPGGARPSQQSTHNFSQPPKGANQPGRSGGTPSTGAQRPNTPSAGARPSTSPSANRPSPSPSAGARSSPTPSANRSSAFDGVSSGSTARSASSRGAASRGGGGGRGGGGRAR